MSVGNETWKSARTFSVGSNRCGDAPPSAGRAPLAVSGVVAADAAGTVAVGAAAPRVGVLRAGVDA